MKKTSLLVAFAAASALAGCAGFERTSLDVNKKDCIVTATTRAKWTDVEKIKHEATRTITVDFKNALAGEEETYRPECPAWLSAPGCHDVSFGPASFGELDEESRKVVAHYGKLLPVACKK